MSAVPLRKVEALSKDGCMEDKYAQGSMLLNLGCGIRLWDEWVNIDVLPEADVVCDIKRLPYPDNHADAIAAIHVIEHFYRWVVHDLLKEWNRVLKPGGKLILELPSMEKVFQQIAAHINAKAPIPVYLSWWPLWGDQKKNDPNEVHKWGYTFGTLSEILLKCGFENVSLEKPRYHIRDRDMRLIAFKPSTTGA